MNKLILSSLFLLFGYQSFAQLVGHQTIDPEFASMLAENPGKVLSGENSLRGFGCFLKLDKSDENFDNLVGFYEIEKEELFEQSVGFYFQAEIVNAEGKVFAQSNKVKAKVPMDGKTVYPIGLTFPGEYVKKLEAGSYELRLSAMPIDKELGKMYKSGNAEVTAFSIR